MNMPTQEAKVPFSVIRQDPLTDRPLGSARESTITHPSSTSFLNSSTVSPLCALAMASSKLELGPLELILASWKKYEGALGISLRIFSTNSFSVSIPKAQLFWICFSRVQKLPSLMLLPQDDPEPWVGQILIEGSTSFLIFWTELKSWAASSSLVTLELAARSGRPTYPKKIVSPVNRQTGFFSESDSQKQELSGVWPGVCRTFSHTAPKLNVYPSFISNSLKLMLGLDDVGPMIIGSSNSV